MSKVIASGYVSLDRVILIDNELKCGHTSIINNHDNSKIFYGGCPVNITYSLNKLGVDAFPLLRVGDDYESSGFKNFLEVSNISLDGINEIKGVNTSSSYLIEDKKGNHHTIFYPGAMSNEYFRPYNTSCYSDIDLGIITVGPLKDNIEFLKQCKNNNVELVFGAKLDKSAFPNEFLREVLEYSTVIFCNEVEEQEFIENLELERITDFFETGNAQIIVVTYGKNGSTCYYKEHNKIVSNHIDIVKVDTCVDTTGSGDAYIAGFIFGYMNHYSVVDSCKLGSTLAHFAVQKMGCITNIPTKEMLLNKMNESGEQHGKNTLYESKQIRHQ